MKTPEQGMKFDSDKIRMDLLDSYAIEQLSAVLTFGAKKYAPNNWRKGIPKSRLIAALLRHTFAYLRGEDIDEESGLSHIAHAMCCCMFILGLEWRADLDDRHVDTDSEFNTDAWSGRSTAIGDWDEMPEEVSFRFPEELAGDEYPDGYPHWDGGGTRTIKDAGLKEFVDFLYSRKK